ncbi:MAG: hypothetical protein J5915_12040 [Acidaminococcaceae bacterium]|nr:hypothetical protein [Acidaminococcaceae bacterium]
MPAVGEVDIIRTLTKKLKARFPDVDVNDRDQKEGFERPSFFIDWLTTKSGKAGEFDADDCFFEIVYYAPERYNGFLDLLQVKKKLRKALSGRIALEPGEELQDTEHFILECEDLEFTCNKEDMALIADFLIKMVQQQDADMEDDYGYPFVQELDNLVQQQDTDMKADDDMKENYDYLLMQELDNDIKLKGD